MISGARAILGVASTADQIGWRARGEAFGEDETEPMQMPTTQARGKADSAWNNVTCRCCR